MLEFVTDWELKVVAQELWSFMAADAPVPICMRAVGLLEGGGWTTPEKRQTSRQFLGIVLLLTKTQMDVYCYRVYHTLMGSVLVLGNGAKFSILVTRYHKSINL